MSLPVSFIVLITISKLTKCWPSPRSAIRAALIALTAEQSVIAIYEAILALVPLIDRASKIGASFLNPSMIPQVMTDISLEVTNLIVDQVKNIPDLVKDAVLNYEIEI